MIDYSLRECPFCGNPAEIVDGMPFSFMPTTPTEKIRCSNEYCFMHGVDLRFQPDVSSSVYSAKQTWNTRKRKNKVTWNRRGEE